MRQVFTRFWRRCAVPAVARIRYGRVRYVESVDEVGQVRRGEVVLVGQTKHPKWALLLCPCGCGETIYVNLMKSHQPHWRVRFCRDGSISLWPSLWRDESRCESHFFLIRGKVVWCQSW